MKAQSSLFLLLSSISLFLTQLNILIFIIIPSSLPATEVYFRNLKPQIFSTILFHGLLSVEIYSCSHWWECRFSPAWMVFCSLLLFSNTKCNLFIAHLKNTHSLSALHRRQIQWSCYFILGVCLLASLFYSKSPALY